MKLGDKKTLLIAGGLAAVAIVVLLAVLLLGGKKPAPDATPAPTLASARGGPGAAALASAPGVPGPQAAAPMPGQMQGPAGAPGAPPAGAPAAGGPSAAPTAAGPTTPVKGKLWGAVRVGGGEYTAVTRPDPLLLLQPPPVPIPPEQLTPLPTVSLQQGGLRPGGQEEPAAVTTVANRRVAGVKFNGGAWAILVSDRDSFVVKPGDVVDGTKINSISREAIYITDPQGQRWVVPLRSAGPGVAAAPILTRRVSGLPNGPSGN